ncbi:MAG: lipopolysaccharide biosynthesis protein [Bacteroidaceae bacterium]|jgi:O-antigen/teichoic acid export membrane protein|nr:lipopolysaccharide biosynthesis protein [Bacteroidaceae bacterium]
MSTKNLKKKAISGMIWTAFQRYSKMFIQFISGIILARLLTPYDYGCIGMLMIFITISESFIDGGFGSALIQKKHPTQVDYSTIFFWNLGMALLLYAILFFSAPTIARFYGIPLLSDVLRVQGIILFIYAFNIVQRNQLRKKMNFKILSIVAIITSIISLTVTIIMAYHGYGVWSLVTQFILTALIPAIVFWFYIKWRPIWTFSWQSFKELFSFGFYMFLSHVLNQFGSQIQGLLIGKFYNASTLGLYSKANGMERLAATSISQVMTHVTYPLYAEVQDDKKVLANMIRRFTMTLSYLTFPLMFVLILCAKPIVILLYTEKWLGCVPFFQVLCIAGLANCLQSVNNQSIAAIGEGKAMLIWTIVKRVVGISFMLLGIIFYGMNGLLIGVVLNSWFSYFVNISQVSKYIGYHWWKQLKDILPVLLLSIAIAVACYILSNYLDLTMYIDGILRFALFVIFYLAFSLIFKMEAYEYTKSIVMQVLSKKFKKK